MVQSEAPLLEQGHTAAGVATSRQRASYLFALIIVGLNFATRIRGWAKVPTPGSDMLATLAASVLLCAGALVHYGDAAVPYTFSLFPIVAGATVIAWNSAAERAHRESFKV